MMADAVENHFNGYAEESSPVQDFVAYSMRLEEIYFRRVLSCVERSSSSSDAYAQRFPSTKYISSPFLSYPVS
jgi:hypothetical protein